MTSHVRKTVRTGMALAGVVVLGWLGGCSDNPGEPIINEDQDTVVVSNLVPLASLFPAQGGALAVDSDGDEVAYVSLVRGTAPNGRRAVVRRTGRTDSLTTAVIDGGFDPVPIAAQVGDSIDVVVRDAGSAVVVSTRVAVRPTRPPVIVRTQPPRDRNDVPVNAAIIVVFSESMGSSTLTPAAIQLFDGTTAVAGTLRFVDASRVSIEFVPAVPLTAGTEYRLVVNESARDLSGDALSAAATIRFTTGSTSTGAAASLRVTPDSTLRLTNGTTYPVKATVRDAAGYVLTAVPIIWSSSDPGGLAVSASGLLTSQRTGSYVITASAGGLSAMLTVSVAPPPAASVEISPSSTTVPVGGYAGLFTTVRDEDGRTIFDAVVTWSSSNTAVATVVASADSAGVASVRGVSQGSVTITATSGTASGAATVTVVPPPSVRFVRPQ